MTLYAIILRGVTFGFCVFALGAVLATLYVQRDAVRDIAVVFSAIFGLICALVSIEEEIAQRKRDQDGEDF